MSLLLQDTDGSDSIDTDEFVGFYLKNTQEFTDEVCRCCLLELLVIVGVRISTLASQI